jgi:hypothetical protein
MTSTAALFLTTKIEGCGVLAAIGDFGLAPVRCLFGGRTVCMIECKKDKEKRFYPSDLGPSSNHIGAVILSVTFLVPAFFLVLFKCMACLSSEVRQKFAHAVEWVNLIAPNNLPPIKALPSPGTNKEEILIDFSRFVLPRSAMSQRQRESLVSSSPAPLPNPADIAQQRQAFESRPFIYDGTVTENDRELGSRERRFPDASDPRLTDAIKSMRLTHIPQYDSGPGKERPVAIVHIIIHVEHSFHPVQFTNVYRDKILQADPLRLIFVFPDGSTHVIERPADTYKYLS